MNQQQNTNKASYTASITPDTLGLGRTPGQRGAEILAGLRAELHPSPETLALCRVGGRVVAGLAMRLEKSRAALNYVVVRPEGLTELARRIVRTRPETSVLVDIAAGYGVRGLALAREMPQLEVIEIDLPDVVQEKQARLKRAHQITIPQNLTWRSADLGITPMGQVLEGRKVDVVVAEGLTAYFTPAENIEIARRIYDDLLPGGSYICDIPWEMGMRSAQNATRFFSRQAGTFKGILPDEEAMREVMLKAGYRDVTVYHPEALAKEIKLPTPTFEFSLFVVATK